HGASSPASRIPEHPSKGSKMSSLTGIVRYSGLVARSAAGSTAWQPMAAPPTLVGRLDRTSLLTIRISPACSALVCTSKASRVHQSSIAASTVKLGSSLQGGKVRSFLRTSWPAFSALRPLCRDLLGGASLVGRHTTPQFRASHTQTTALAVYRTLAAA